MSEMMKAAVYDGTPKIKLTELPVPQVGPKEALLKVHACGICGTDMRILASGHHRISSGSLHVLGHELAGEIVEVGSEVSWPKVGTRVALSPNMGCGHCDMCIQGYTQLCANYISFGVYLNGGFAEYTLIPREAIEQGNVVELPANLSFEEAAVNEPLSCAFRGMMACHPQPGETVLVVGSGPIGLMHMKVAKAVGAGKVIISEPSPERAKQAKEMGADYVVNPREQNLAEAIAELTSGRGADVAVVAVPSGAAQAETLGLLAYHGRINFFGGLPKGNDLAQIQSNLVHYRELVITGTTGQTVKQYRTTMEMIGNGQIEVASLVTDKFALKDAVAAFEKATDRTGLKTMILPNS